MLGKCNVFTRLHRQTSSICSFDLSLSQLNFGKVRINGSTEVGTLEDGRRVHGSFFGQSSFGRYALVKASSVRSGTGAHAFRFIGLNVDVCLAVREN